MGVTRDLLSRPPVPGVTTGVRLRSGLEGREGRGATNVPWGTRTLVSCPYPKWVR